MGRLTSATVFRNGTEGRQSTLGRRFASSEPQLAPKSSRKSSSSAPKRSNGAHDRVAPLREVENAEQSVRHSQTSSGPGAEAVSAAKPRPASDPSKATAAAAPKSGEGGASSALGGAEESAPKSIREACRLAARRAEAEAAVHGRVGPVTAAEGSSDQRDYGAMVKRATGAVARAPAVALRATGAFLITFARDPRGCLSTGWMHLKEGAEHYWLGSKLLWADTRTATRLVRRVVAGHRLTRRERKQLLRTASDLARLVPFAFFILVPLMEFALPLALKLFPNMLPSTFQSAFAKQETLIKNMRARVEMTTFMQETLIEMAKTAQAQGASGDLAAYLDAARRGEQIDNDRIIQLARVFEDEITLDNVSRPQLVTMCQYMGMRPYGNDAMLRFQLRNRVRQLKNDDQLILWEGAESLDADELRQACAERGMRATGLTKTGYRRQLTQWLELSVNKEVPITLLILSRAFTMPRSMSELEATLTASISQMDEEVVNEVLLEKAGGDDNDSRSRRLESLRYQNELIQDEAEEETRAQEQERERKSQEARAKAAAEAEVAEAAAAAKAATDADMAAAAEKQPQSAADTATAAREGGQQGAAAGAAVGGSTSAHEQTERELTDKFAHVTAEEAAKVAKEELVSATEADEAKAAGDDGWLSRRAKELQRLMAAVRAKEELEAIEQEDGVTELSQEQIEALTRLASDSVVVREREQLQQLTRLHAVVMAEEEAAASSEDSSRRASSYGTDMVRRRVARMMAGLEKEMASVDEAIGGDLRVLDHDMDGVLSKEELKRAVQAVLATHNTAEEAEKVVEMLDHNKDGKVTVKELLRFAVKKEQEKS